MNKLCFSKNPSSNQIFWKKKDSVVLRDSSNTYYQLILIREDVAGHNQITPTLFAVF